MNIEATLRADIGFFQGGFDYEGGTGEGARNF